MLPLTVISEYKRTNLYSKDDSLIVNANEDSLKIQEKFLDTITFLLQNAVV